MQLQDTSYRIMNPGASQELVIPITLLPPISGDKYKSNLEKNIVLDIPWLDESPVNDRPAVVCGAAPSMRKYTDTIKEISTKGAVFACNSAAKYLIDHGIEVDFQPMLDPHPIMIESMHSGAKSHLLASYVDPALFKVANNPVIWHPCEEWVEERLKDEQRSFTYIGVGISVAISTLCIAYTMGHREIHVFGMDSCFEGDAFYANGKGAVTGETAPLYVDVEFNGKTYKTTYDMKQQVLVFVEIAKLLLKHGVQLKVYGDGLLQDVWRSSNTELPTVS